MCLRIWKVSSPIATKNVKKKMAVNRLNCDLIEEHIRGERKSHRHWSKNSSPCPQALSRERTV